MAKKLYFIAIEMPEPLKSEIQGLKEDLSNIYISKHALKTPPHITLQMPMRIEEKYEDKLLQSIGESKINFTTRIVKLNNISSFPPRTIFIDVLAKDVVIDLYEAVQEQINKLNFISDKISISSFHPHITLLTRDLNITKYQSAFNSIISYKFEQQIEIASFQLYKHNGKLWEVIKTFELDLL